MTDREESSSARVDDVLRERARRLARRTDAGASTTVGVEMLLLTVGRERFAIESRYVIAVVQLVDLVPLPGATAPVVGLTRWRGDVLTVLDLRRVLGGMPGALDDLGRVIVLGESAPEFGVLADAVEQLVHIDPATLHPLPANRPLEIENLLIGVTTDAVHVLNAAVLISHQANAQGQQAFAQPSTPALL